MTRRPRRFARLRGFRAHPDRERGAAPRAHAFEQRRNLLAETRDRAALRSKGEPRASVDRRDRRTRSEHQAGVGLESIAEPPNAFEDVLGHGGSCGEDQRHLVFASIQKGVGATDDGRADRFPWLSDSGCRLPGARRGRSAAEREGHCRCRRRGPALAAAGEGYQREIAMEAVQSKDSVLGQLRQIVKRHRVTYRIDPALEIVGNARVTVGYDVELLGAHPAHAGVTPGCSRCFPLWQDLDLIGRAVRERLDGRASVTLAMPFRPELTSSKAPDGTDRDEVRLDLAIRHRSGYFEPVDHCEQTCLGDIVDMLRLIGVKPAAR